MKFNLSSTQSIRMLLLTIVFSQNVHSSESYGVIKPDINACKVISTNYQKLETPIDQDGNVLGDTVIIEKENVEFCSGSLIQNGSAILTAAHCFQGNLEQQIRREIVAIPKEEKVIINGEEVTQRIKGCENEDWYEQKRCIKNLVRLKTQVKLNQVKVQCFGSDGQMEERSLKPELGYPHPFFFAESTQVKESFSGPMEHSLKMRKTANDYDIALWKFENPITTVKSMPLNFDFEKFSKMINQDSYDYSRPDLAFCKSYGFGTADGEKQGSYKVHMMNVIDMRINVIFTGFEELRHGDSGGPLVCQNANGELAQVGINTRVNKNDSSGQFFNAFSTLAYNFDWLDFVNKKAKAYKETKEWHEMVLPYEIQYVENQFSEAGKCRKQQKKNNSKEFGKAIDESYFFIKNQIAKGYKMNNDSKQPKVFARANFKEARRSLNDFLFNCSFDFKNM